MHRENGGFIGRGDRVPQPPPGGTAGLAQQTPAAQTSLLGMGPMRLGTGRSPGGGSRKSPPRYARPKPTRARARPKPKRPARMVKGSRAAKTYMAKLRRMAGRARKHK